MPTTVKKAADQLAARGIKGGVRVRFSAAVERFPFFIVPKGALGTVEPMSDGDTCLAVKLDDPPEGVPGGDHGCVFLLLAEDADIIAGDMEVLP